MDVERFTKTLSQIRSMILSVVMTAMVLALLIIIIRQFKGDAVVVKALNVPVRLAEMGYSPEVSAQLIVDGMQTIQSLANTRKIRRGLVPDASRFDVEMPGSGLSVNTIGRILRESIGISEATVSGEIVQAEGGYRLHLRYIHGSQFTVVSTEPNESIEALLRQGAENSVEMINPYMLAAYLYGDGLAEPGKENDSSKRRQRFHDLLKVCIENEPKDDDAWAYNLWGISLASERKYDEAIEKYRIAIQQNPRFALAYNNWGNALLNREDFKEAEEKYAKAFVIDRRLMQARTGKYFAQGMVYYEKEMYSDAVRKFKAIVESDPAFADAHAWLGKSLQSWLMEDDSDAKNVNKAKIAIEHYEIAQKIDPDRYLKKQKLSIAKLRKYLQSSE